MIIEFKQKSLIDGYWETYSTCSCKYVTICQFLHLVFEEGLFSYGNTFHISVVYINITHEIWLFYMNAGRTQTSALPDTWGTWRGSVQTRRNHRKLTTREKRRPSQRSQGCCCVHWRPHQTTGLSLRLHSDRQRDIYQVWWGQRRPEQDRWLPTKCVQKSRSQFDKKPKLDWQREHGSSTASPTCISSVRIGQHGSSTASTTTTTWPLCSHYISASSSTSGCARKYTSTSSTTSRHDVFATTTTGVALCPTSPSRRRCLPQSSARQYSSQTVSGAGLSNETTLLDTHTDPRKQVL